MYFRFFQKVSLIALFGNEEVMSIRSLRTLRALRPLRAISRFERMRVSYYFDDCCMICGASRQATYFNQCPFQPNSIWNILNKWPFTSCMTHAGNHGNCFYRLGLDINYFCNYHDSLQVRLIDGISHVSFASSSSKKLEYKENTTKYKFVLKASEPCYNDDISNLTYWP